MKCEQYIKNINKYLNNDLEIDELRDFIEHVDECPKCKEELTIELLVKDGLKSLESGNAFDLNEAYRKRIVNSEHSIRRNESIQWVNYGLYGLVLVAFCVLLILMAFV